MRHLTPAEIDLEAAVRPYCTDRWPTSDEEQQRFRHCCPAGSLLNDRTLAALVAVREQAGRDGRRGVE